MIICKFSKKLTICLIFQIIFYIQLCSSAGILYPRESETREIKSLDGFWDFYIPEEPARNDIEYYLDDSYYRVGLPYDEVMQMPVPASYNDVTVDARLRDYVGTVWYEKKFFVPRSWQDSSQRIFLRFSSVHYRARVWVNGYEVAAHEGGHLPFQAEVTPWLDFGVSNRITVSVDNELTDITVPQGVVRTLDIGNGKTRRQQTYSFDFFNYAGIHRPVVLYTTPSVYIDDITVTSTIANSGQGYDALISYEVLTIGDNFPEPIPECSISLVDAAGVYRVRRQSGCQGVLILNDAKLWWPRYMNSQPGYLYTLEVELLVDSSVLDVYRLPIGIRSIYFNSTSVLINGKPLYIRGVGRHEDADFRGKGLDLPLLSRETHLMNWLGANCYRTSHYPYSEESMQVADQQGFLVIDETPGVNTEFFSNDLLSAHERSLTELIQRDKNHPSVFMWSLSNEPRTQHTESEPYFRQLRDLARDLDYTRPITIVIAQSYENDQVAQLLDVICFNRYNAWYSDGGQLAVIAVNVENEARAWYQTFNKPIIMAEYGGDTMPGLHRLPAFIWSEEFQTQLLSEHFKAFDKLREEGFFIGEMIWNFADFQTDQSYTRVGGNKKGVFTRDRQPKAAAFLLRQRYWALANLIDGAPALNASQNIYISPPKRRHHSEL